MGALVQNLTRFARLLREAGVATGPERLRLCLQAVEELGLRERSTLYYAARATLVYRRQDLPLFDRAFAAFWRRPPSSVMPARRSPKRPALVTPTQAGRPQRAGAYSPLEVLRRKDFGQMTEAELEQVRGMIAALGWRLGQRLSRRKQVGAGTQLDYRRSWRTNLRFGGEPVIRVWRRRQHKPRPLVVIADVSGSMERYSELLLHFLHGLMRDLTQPVEAFVFSTRLSRVTRQLRQRQAHQALHAIADVVPDWSGGTRIGAAIRTFNFRWARRTLGQGAVVAVVSDGLDRGQLELLRRELARLRRSSHRLLWLNPLLGSPDYQPLARGMQAALPHLDHFLPAHNLISLEELAASLPQLSNRRPPR